MLHSLVYANVTQTVGWKSRDYKHSEALRGPGESGKL